MPRIYNTSKVDELVILAEVSLLAMIGILVRLLWVEHIDIGPAIAPLCGDVHLFSHRKMYRYLTNTLLPFGSVRSAFGHVIYRLQGEAIFSDGSWGLLVLARILPGRWPGKHPNTATFPSHQIITNS
jgi:hypothetical protein